MFQKTNESTEVDFFSVMFPPIQFDSGTFGANNAAQRL